MTQPDEHRDPTPERNEQQAQDAMAEEGDFAEEHTSPTFADEQSGGPEGSSEPEAPDGYSGLETDHRPL